MKEPELPSTPDFVKLIANIDEFKGRWQALGSLPPERLRARRRVATIKSIGASTRLGGANLSDAQVETLLSSLATTSVLSRDEQVVAGYAEAMGLVFEAFADLALSENHLRQLHQTLLRHSPKDERHRGSYKTVTDHMARLHAGARDAGNVFETAAPIDTPREMEELVAWTTQAIGEDVFHPLLIVAVFVAVFLAIHPFQDGNGRLSRLVTTLLLLRAGYDYVLYASLESVIEENKDLYRQALSRTQTALGRDSEDWEPWIGFFLRCLKKQKDDLALWLDREQAAALDETDLPELSVRVLALIRKRQRQTIAQLAAATGANRNTLKVRLRELVTSRRIRRHGKARATWYSE